ncbi:hypothetical protein ACJMK2_000776 [Sinanodonta woodiana]|uniref:Gamma-butyrobetaine dioxygenase n=1 Tax=Sinanodonta woodiana TaxID=1069815 RepID=A0ABD3XSL0_SINWO
MSGTSRHLMLCVKKTRNLHRSYIRHIVTLSSYQHKRLIQRWQDPTSHAYGIRFYTMPIQNVTVKQKHVASADLEDNGRQLVITWMDGVRSRYHSLWLRFSCQCPECFHTSSNMKQIHVEEIDFHTVLEKVSVSEDGLSLSLMWSSGGHMGTIDLASLRANRYDPDALATRHKLTSALFLQEVDPIPEVSYEEVNRSDKGIYKWLSYISDYGICLMKGVPTEKRSILLAVEKIAPVRKTSYYGDVYDVVQEYKPSHVAYSPVKLPLHMDYLYQDGAPGLQFLHCLRFDDTVKGGDSTFVDLFRVAEDFRKRFPDEFKVLTRVPVIFSKVHLDREHPIYMVHERKHIEVNNVGEIVRISWHPLTQSSMAVPEEDLEAYYDAYLKFANMIQTSPSYRQLRLRPGDLMAFNNRRMVHGRTAYQETIVGQRHMQGCSVSIDDFKSRLQVLSLTVGDGRLSKRVFNGSTF